MLNNNSDIILLLASLYHLIAGIFVLGPKSWAQYFAKNTYKLNIPSEYEPRYEVTLRFLGLMAISFSFLLFIIIKDGSNLIKFYSQLVLGCLFIGRAFLRYYLKEKILDAYQLPYRKSILNIIFNINIGLITFLSAYYLFKDIQ